MRGDDIWIVVLAEELGDVTPDEERGIDGKTEAELEAEYAQDDENEELHND